MFDRILVPLDGSPFAETILPAVQDLAELAGSRLRLVTVIPRLAGESERRGAWHYLERVRDRLVAEGLSPAIQVEQGTPVMGILEQARAGACALIALSTHGRTGSRLALRGSVAEAVLRRAPQPVLAVNPHAVTEGRRLVPGRVKSLLVPLDGTRPSARIVHLVAGLARAYGAEVLLFHAFAAKGAEDSAWGPLADHALRTLERHGVRQRVRVEQGAPADAILRVAEEEDADLVAMTTHGASGSSAPAFGSVAAEVLRACPRPLLVLRTGGWTREEQGPRRDRETQWIRRKGEVLLHQPH